MLNEGKGERGMGRMALLIGLCAAAVVVAGLGVARTPETSPASMVRVEISAPQSNKTAIPIAVRMGSRFSVTLDSNVTTGYKWQLARPVDGKVLKLIGSTYNAPEDGRVGQGGTETWTFEAVGKGKTKFTLNYVRPWEKNTPPAKTQSFDIDVR
jgi:inhibitor of cysteine peptidase